MKAVLLATVFALGTVAVASAQSQMNQTPPNAQRDPTISSATHCMDKATNQPRMRQTTGTGGGSAAAGNATAGDKSARSTGTSSQSPAAPGGAGGAMHSNLSAC